MLKGILNLPLLKKNPDRLKIQKIKTSNGVFGILFFLIILTIYLLPIGIVFANTSGVTLTVNVATCGDGAVDIGEQCDGSSLGNANCASLGFNGGTLGCNASCNYATS